MEFIKWTRLVINHDLVGRPSFLAIKGRADSAYTVYTNSLWVTFRGIAGNLADRIRFGWVTDFLDFQFGSYHYPSFNLADASICVGAITIYL